MKVKLALLLTLIGTLPLAAQNVRQEQDTVSYMNDDPFNLEQIVVTATRTEKKIKNTPVITQIITSKQIEERGTGNIQDLLTQEVPGLNFQEVGYGTSIDIQGLGSKHILFLIDGERIAGENGGNIDYSRINLRLLPGLASEHAVLFANHIKIFSERAFALLFSHNGGSA